MIRHANRWGFRQRKSFVCGATSSVRAGIDSYGEEARVAAAPSDTATTSFAVAVRTAKGRRDLLSAAYVR